MTLAMLPRFLDCRRLRKSRPAWAAAWLAVALNVLAPVAAYASSIARQTTSPAAGAEHAMHRHVAMHRQQLATHHETPAAPHCQYCLDFAAGAPLALVVEVPVAAPAPQGEPSVGRLPAPRAYLRIALAYARAPPSLFA